MIKILFIGDTYGEPGRKAVTRFVPKMKKSGEADFVVCNAENAADGAGLTEKTAQELLAVGCDVLTMGDHAFDKRKDIEAMMKRDPRLLRPVNFPPSCAGVGSAVYTFGRINIGVIHLAGRVFMRYHFTCPFTALDEHTQKLTSLGAKIILVDFHAEATSEKMALSWYADGRVSAVVGTHTHVPTADDRVTTKGTACVTDLGMTGPYDSVIGAEKEGILTRFITQVGGRKEVASQDIRLSGALVTIDEASGRALSIRRVHERLDV